MARWLTFSKITFLLLCFSPLSAQGQRSPVSAVLTPDGTLQVTGTQQADDFVLRLGTGGTLEVDDRGNGPGADFTFAVEQIARLRVTVGDGDDRVVFDDSGGALADLGKPVEIQGGPGSDRLFASTSGLEPEQAEALVATLREMDALSRLRRGLRRRATTASPEPCRCWCGCRRTSWQPRRGWRLKARPGWARMDGSSWRS